MSASSCTPPPAAPAALGSGGASGQRFDTLHERSKSESAQNRLAMHALQDKGIHKLMRLWNPQGQNCEILLQIDLGFYISLIIERT